MGACRSSSRRRRVTDSSPRQASLCTRVWPLPPSSRRRLSHSFIPTSPSSPSPTPSPPSSTPYAMPNIAPITGKLRKRFWLDLTTALGLGVSAGYTFWSVPSAFLLRHSNSHPRDRYGVHLKHGEHPSIFLRQRVQHPPGMAHPCHMPLVSYPRADWLLFLFAHSPAPGGALPEARAGQTAGAVNMGTFCITSTIPSSSLPYPPRHVSQRSLLCTRLSRAATPSLDRTGRDLVQFLPLHHEFRQTPRPCGPDAFNHTIHKSGIAQR